jgi:hypothetical protein
MATKNKDLAMSGGRDNLGLEDDRGREKSVGEGKYINPTDKLLIS